MFSPTGIPGPPLEMRGKGDIRAFGVIAVEDFETQLRIQFVVDVEVEIIEQRFVAQSLAVTDLPGFR